MTLGALMELIDEPDYLQKELAKLNIDGYHLHVTKTKKNGITGTLCRCSFRGTSTSS